MQFPLTISFKLLTLVPQMAVRDGTGQAIGYVRQKLLAIKESVTVFADEAQTKPIYAIKADRVIDFNANYHITDAEGRPLGLVRREGMRSLWRAHYMICLGEEPTLEVNEESALVRLIDGVLGEIPLLGAFTGYFLNPKYHVSRPGGAPVLLMTKRPSFFETEFTIEQRGAVAPDEQALALLGLMMIILLERSRG